MLSLVLLAIIFAKKSLKIFDIVIRLEAGVPSAIVLSPEMFLIVYKKVLHFSIYFCYRISWI